MHPEEKSRLIIDKKLEEAGWILQDMDEFNPRVASGVIVREFPTSSGPADYAIFLDTNLIGFIEAKEDNKGQNIIDAEEQNDRYFNSNIKNLLPEKDRRRFTYEATSVITKFKDYRDIKSRSRNIFSFHQPQYLRYLIDSSDTIRNNVKNLPVLNPNGFRKCQVNAINGLDKSFSENKPRSLVQMTTGAGKTYIAVTQAYRLIRYGNFRRVLFLVDTKQLGEQAEEEFKKYKPNDDYRLFPELYNIIRLDERMRDIPEETQVCISTIQRMYAKLRGQIELEEDDEESPYEREAQITRPKEVVYNHQYPPEFFDLIIVDECHRSIYNIWKQVFDYFDAFVIGITATPDKRTLGFFNANLVSEYSHEEAVRDQVNVSGEIYRIKTNITEKGGVICEPLIEIRDRLSRKKRWEMNDDEISYSKKELDKSVINESQIRLVISTFKEKYNTEIFPNRLEVPKTLIFAKTDSHADDIIRVVKEEFGEGDNFCKKITYKANDPKNVLSSFRNDYYPRIAVTVDMISAGTDIKCLECLIFMRDVRSSQCFEQMKGRGVRTLPYESLKSVSPSATNNKDKYVLIDAVGVCESHKNTSRTLERKPGVTVKELLQKIVLGSRNEDILTTLSGRLFRLNDVLDEKERTNFNNISGTSLGEIGGHILDCFDEDYINNKAIEKYHLSNPEDITKEKLLEVKSEELEKACEILYSPEVRKFIVEARQNHDQIVDTENIDSLISVGWGDKREEKAKSIITSYKEFLDKNKDEIDALSIIYNNNYLNKKLTLDMLDRLLEKMNSNGFNLDNLWEAYSIDNVKNVKGNGIVRKTSDLISLVKIGFGLTNSLEPFADTVRLRFRDWILRKNAGNIHFNEEEVMWLQMIRDHISSSVEIHKEDFEYPPFDSHGGLGKYYAVFGTEYIKLLDELNQALVM